MAVSDKTPDYMFSQLTVNPAMTKECISKENNKGHPQGKPNRSFVFKLQMKPGNCQCGRILF